MKLPRKPLKNEEQSAHETDFRRNRVLLTVAFPVVILALYLQIPQFQISPYLDMSSCLPANWEKPECIWCWQIWGDLWPLLPLFGFVHSRTWKAGCELQLPNGIGRGWREGWFTLVYMEWWLPSVNFRVDRTKECTSPEPMPGK